MTRCSKYLLIDGFLLSALSVSGYCAWDLIAAGPGITRQVDST